MQLELFQTISESGLSAFSPGMFALLLTAGSALYLAVISARGYVLPRPLSAGVVMMATGIWCAVLTGLLTADTPSQIFGIRQVETEFGQFVAFGRSGRDHGGWHAHASAEPVRPRNEARRPPGASLRMGGAPRERDVLPPGLSLSCNGHTS